MYKPCPYCNKKKEHRHKGCNEIAEITQIIKPQKKKNVKRNWSCWRTNTNNIWKIRSVKKKDKWDNKTLKRKW